MAGAHFDKIAFVLSMLGALLVLEGIPYFGFPKAVKQWAAFLRNMPEKKLRVMGLIIMAAGIILLYALNGMRN